MSGRFARDDLVEVEHETGRFAGKVVEARPATERDEEILVVLTQPEGQLLTVYARHCRLSAGQVAAPKDTAA